MPCGSTDMICTDLRSYITLDHISNPQNHGCWLIKLSLSLFHLHSCFLSGCLLTYGCLLTCGWLLICGWLLFEGVTANTVHFISKLWVTPITQVIYPRSPHLHLVLVEGREGLGTRLGVIYFNTLCKFLKWGHPDYSFFFFFLFLEMHAVGACVSQCTH